MKKIVLVLITFLCLTGLAIGMDGDPNFSKTYESSMGNITFNHQSHTESLKDCVVCHTVYDVSEDTMNKKTAHKLCRDCHTKSQVETAPTKCKGCHVK